jgi:hypothetical protein
LALRIAQTGPEYRSDAARKPTRHIVRTFDDPGAFSSDHADVQIGPHSFKGDLETYAIRVDAVETSGVGCDLVLRRRVASYRSATGYIEAGDKFFAWLVAVPEGAVTETLTADGVTRQVTGSGYHDHNWGNVSPANLCSRKRSFHNRSFCEFSPRKRSAPPIPGLPDHNLRNSSAPPTLSARSSALLTLAVLRFSLIFWCTHRAHAALLLLEELSPRSAPSLDH